MNIKQELLKIATELSFDTYYKEVAQAYTSFFKGCGFTNIAIKVKDITNSYYKNIIYKNIVFTATKDDETTIILTITYNEEKQNSVYMRLEGNINNKAIRKKKDFLDITDSLNPNNFIKKAVLEKAMDTAIMKKFSRADAMIAIDKNFIVSDRFGSPKEQDPDLFVQVTDEAFVKISRMKFRRSAYWQCIGIYIAEGRYKLTFDNTIKVTKSFEETEEGMKDLVTYIKQIQIQVRKELAKNNTTMITSKKKEVKVSLKDVFNAKKNTILKQLKTYFGTTKVLNIKETADTLIIDFDSSKDDCEKINLQITNAKKEMQIMVDVGYIKKSGSPTYESETGFSHSLEDLIRYASIKLLGEVK